MTTPHFIEIENEYWIAFFPDSCRFFKVNQNGKTLIEEICSGAGFEEIASKYGLSREQFDSYIKQIESYATPAPAAKKQETEDEGSSYLDRLVIHVSNDCNLRCIYCYACGGDYGTQRTLMSMDMLHIALDRFFQHYEHIGSLQIFGGEPLMNFPAVREICAYVAENEAKTGKKTKVAIVTNGTLINDEFIELVKKYKMGVTISYDGEEKTNDQLRIFPNHAGSSSVILQKAKALYDATGEPNTIEVTYTQLHVENHVGIPGIVRRIRELLPNVGIHLVPVYGEEGAPYTLKDYGMFPDSVDAMFQGDRKDAPLYSLVQHIFEGLSEHDPDNLYICGAGVGTLSVSVEGEVYPCFMFTNMKALSLGNVQDEQVFEREQFHSRLEKLRRFNDKRLNEACRNCFARTLCTGCLGTNARHNGENFEINETECEMTRNMMTRAIIQYVNHGLMEEK